MIKQLINPENGIKGDEKMEELIQKARSVKKASIKLQSVSTVQKNEALLQIGAALKRKEDAILKANKMDVKEARDKGIRDSLIDRLALNQKRIDDMIQSCHRVAGLKDPVGEVIASWVQSDGLRISKVRVPIGAIGIIYESRPNVTVEASILALKTGNSILLRGGSDAFHSNMAIVKAIKEGLSRSSLPVESIEIVESTDRKLVEQMLKLREYLSLIVPRGSNRLIQYVVENSSIPVLETGVGNCHIFVDDSADLEKALEIVDNAKTQRPGTCNAVETLLVHQSIAAAFLPMMADRLSKKGVEIRGCSQTQKFIKVKPATDSDWETEFLDLILAVRVVNSLDEAIAHIQKYSSGHSEAILTENYFNAKKFVENIDAAAVYVNASTRFTDGGQFGFGGEIGISTQRLHARGPVGLEGLTTYKYVILGDYNVRR